jgi:hypothetical protein
MKHLIATSAVVLFVFGLTGCQSMDIVSDQPMVNSRPVRLENQVLLKNRFPYPLKVFWEEGKKSQVIPLKKSSYLVFERRYTIDEVLIYKIDPANPEVELKDLDPADRRLYKKMKGKSSEGGFTIYVVQE